MDLNLSAGRHTGPFEDNSTGSIVSYIIHEISMSL